MTGNAWQHSLFCQKLEAETQTNHARNRIFWHATPASFSGGAHTILHLCMGQVWLPQRMDGYGWEILRRTSTKSWRWRGAVIRPMPPSSHLESVHSFFPKTMNLFDIEMVLPPPAGPSQNSRPYQRNSSQSVSFRCSCAISLQICSTYPNSQKSTSSLQ
jgi:hypothetical protein